MDCLISFEKHQRVIYFNKGWLQLFSQKIEGRGALRSDHLRNVQMVIDTIVGIKSP